MGDQGCHWLCQCLRGVRVAGEPENTGRASATRKGTWGFSKLANVCKAQGDTEREAWARQRLKEIKPVSGE
jgi:hypothetical protein